MNGFAKGFFIAEQTDKAFCKVAVVSKGPEAAAVPVHDYGLAGFHALYVGVAAVQRYEGFIVGVRGANDGHRKPAIYVLGLQ
ncbi:hypothetical protein JCM12856_22430 [Spirochaeta dissipatitropha]